MFTLSRIVPLLSSGSHTMFLRGETLGELHEHYHFVILMERSEESEYAPTHHLQIFRFSRNNRAKGKHKKSLRTASSKKKIGSKRPYDRLKMSLCFFRCPAGFTERWRHLQKTFHTAKIFYINAINIELYFYLCSSY